MQIRMNFERGYIDSLILGGVERLVGKLPIFTVCLRGKEGQIYETDAFDARYENGVYVGLKHIRQVKVDMQECADEVRWRVAVTPCSGWAVEWIDFPSVSLPDLQMQDSERGGTVLYPYNEGALIKDRELRDRTAFRSVAPKYPSHGCMPVFPNMVCSQMLGYLWEDCGLYMGAHDPSRGVKGIDFVGNGRGVTMRMRLFAGQDFDMPYVMDWDIVWREINGQWESAAEIYRAWFESALPCGVRKVADNPNLPDWYADAPLVVSYPVRGRFDTDEMTPNAFYPYTNALPLLNDIKTRTGSRIMALLMHWEGTAPWAPPYVWPPYGDVADFDRFKNILHEQGDLLGVYCSGFGYTLSSNLVEYDCQDDYKQRNLEAGMCAGPDGRVAISRICPGQRKGYDICPASPVGREILEEAYRPLLESGVDYSQILDQNHGGGQYFCYSREHGHPPVPGGWMTKNMQQVLGTWNEIGKQMLLGCESAAAEPFIGNLQLSDNRFELNYHCGRPVPLYAYLYHEYLRNFMGNQVSCPFPSDIETLPYRLSYSFCIGDLMTLVLSPAGEILTRWGARPDAIPANKEQVMRLVANLTAFYHDQAKPYLHHGRMTAADKLECDTLTYKTWHGSCQLPSVLCSAWEGDVHILVNPLDREQTVRLGGRTITVPALDAILVK